MSKLWHMIEHWLGWNTGEVVSKLDHQGRVWIGFKCDKCGQITGKTLTDF